MRRLKFGTPNVKFSFNRIKTDHNVDRFLIITLILLTFMSCKFLTLKTLNTEPVHCVLNLLADITAIYLSVSKTELICKCRICIFPPKHDPHTPLLKQVVKKYAVGRREQR